MNTRSCFEGKNSFFALFDRFLGPSFGIMGINGIGAGKIAIDCARGPVAAVIVVVWGQAGVSD